MIAILVALSLSGLSWIYLLAFRGQFWRCDQRLDPSNQASLTEWPSICVVIPARNEASMLPQSLPSLLGQQYPGKLSILLVDDQSTDGTADLARQLAREMAPTDQARHLVQIITTDPLPTGWSGKLWAVHQGIQSVLNQSADNLPDYFLLTDADILHETHNLRQLMLKAEQEHLDLVSLMVLLRCESFWEKLLIPAFVFFFQKLYPFPWVNQPQHPMGAAAGGCVLVRRKSLIQVGGIEVIRNALIDDCTLGAAIKDNGGKGSSHGRIWLGLTDTTVSLRPYPTLKTIWDMVARTAFTQLHYSFVLLGGSLAGMMLVYAMPVLGLLFSGFNGFGVGSITAMGVWALMAITYWPTIRLYRLSPLWTLTLPIVGILYTLMTLDSALRHVQGKGGAWKGRVYATESVK